MKIFTLSLALLVGALSLSSCATIFTGTKDSITFDSTPEGAKVIQKGIEKCITPCTIDVPRSLSKQMVEIKKALQKQGFFGIANILFGGIIGFGIDLGTGAFVKYDQKSHHVELTAQK